MGQRPSLRLGMSHLSTASNNMNTFFHNQVPSPISGTGSANPSPVSSANEGSECSNPCLSAAPSPLATSPQFTNSFGRSHNFSTGSPAFQRQGWPSSQNTVAGLGGQPFASASQADPSLADTSYICGSLPPLQYRRPTLQTRDEQRFGRTQTTDGSPHESGVGMNDNSISPLSSPSSLSYNQSNMLYTSSSGSRASSYYQNLDSSCWQGSQLSAQGYQYGQQLQPFQASEQRRGSESLHSPLSQEPLVNRRDQRSYSVHGGENYRGGDSSTDTPAQSSFLGAEAATGRDTDAARPRARSCTFPAFYSSQY